MMFTAALERSDGGACVSRLRFAADRLLRDPRAGCSFREDLPAYAAALRRLRGPGAVRAFAQVCQQLRAGAEATGLEALHAAAVRAVGEVRRTRDLRCSEGVIRALAWACDRAFSGAAGA